MEPKVGVPPCTPTWRPENSGNIWPQSFKCWIALSTGQITIQWISVDITNYTIHWIVIYLVDRVIHLLNNRGLELTMDILMTI